MSLRLRSLLLAGVLWLACAPCPATTMIVCDDVNEPLSLDPFSSFSEKGDTIIRQIYEGLVRFDVDGKIEPALAVSWKWKDPLTLEFDLRRDVSFQNGERFDSAAARLSIERYLDAKGGFPGLPFISGIERVETDGPWTVRVVTRHPDGLLLNRLASFIVIAPPKLLRERPESLKRSPVGTGPFRLKQWEKDERIVLAANGNYYRPGYPRLQELQMRFLPPRRQIEDLLSGALDLVTELPGTETLKVKSYPSTQVIKRPAFYGVYGHFNTRRGPLQNIQIRKAINLAINKADVIRYDVLGNGRILASMSMPGEAGHDPSLRPYPYDPRQARRLLREAGAVLPLRLKTIVSIAERPARIIAKQLEAVGVILDLHVVPDREVLQNIGSKDWDMGIAAVPDPMAHIAFPLGLLFYSASPYSLHSDPEFDRLLDEASATQDPALSEKRFQDLDRLVHEQVLGIFVYQRIKTYGLQRHAHFTPSVTGMPLFESLEHREVAR